MGLRERKILSGKQGFMKNNVRETRTKWKVMKSRVGTKILKGFRVEYLNWKKKNILEWKIEIEEIK